MQTSRNVINSNAFNETVNDSIIIRVTWYCRCTCTSQQVGQTLTTLFNKQNLSLLCWKSQRQLQQYYCWIWWISAGGQAGSEVTCALKLVHSTQCSIQIYTWLSVLEIEVVPLKASAGTTYKVGWHDGDWWSQIVVHSLTNRVGMKWNRTIFAWE